MKKLEKLASDYVTFLLEDSADVSCGTAFLAGYASAASDYQAAIAELQKQLKEKDERIEDLHANIREMDELRD